MSPLNNPAFKHSTFRHLTFKHGYQKLINGKRLHYLACGQAGAVPIILLHSPPTSARFMAPVMEAMAAQAYVIAPDIPGYGLSDEVTDSSIGLAPFVEALADFLSQMNIGLPVLYGFAAGAQLAIEYAKTYPKRLAGLILDDLAHFENVKHRQNIRQYFPKRVPASDGSHLTSHWLSARNPEKFFPGFETLKQGQPRQEVLSLEAVQAQLLDQLYAGANYGRVAIAALQNQDEKNIPLIRTPTRILRWQGSLLWPEMQAFDVESWPAHIKLVDCAGSHTDRMQAICAIYEQLKPFGQSHQPDTKNFAKRLLVDGAAWSDAGDSEALHWQGRAAQKACVLLHDLGASSRFFGPLLNQPEPVLAVDLAGHGRSGGKFNIAVCARQIAEDLRILGVSKVNLIGVGLGAAVGFELATLIRQCSRFLAIDALAPEPLADMTPVWSGSHLLETWHALKDSWLYYPWHQHTEVQQLKRVEGLDQEALQEAMLDRLVSAQSAPVWHSQLSAFAWPVKRALLNKEVSVENACWRAPAITNLTLQLPFDRKSWPEALADYLTVQ